MDIVSSLLLLIRLSDKVFYNLESFERPSVASCGVYKFLYIEDCSSNFFFMWVIFLSSADYSIIYCAHYARSVFPLKFSNGVQLLINIDVD